MVEENGEGTWACEVSVRVRVRVRPCMVEVDHRIARYALDLTAITISCWSIFCKM